MAADGQRCLFAEEVIGVINLSVFILFEVIEVLGCDLKHLAGALAIRRGNQRRMKIEIAVLVEIGVDCHRHVVTDAEDRAKRVGARTQVCYRAEKLHTQTFLLQRIFLRIGGAIDLQLRQLDLHGLTCSLALYQNTRGGDTRTGRNGFQLFLAKLLQIRYDLNVLNG